MQSFAAVASRVMPNSAKMLGGEAFTPHSSKNSSQLALPWRSMAICFSRSLASAWLDLQPHSAFELPPQRFRALTYGFRRLVRVPQRLTLGERPPSWRCPAHFALPLSAALFAP